MPQNSLRYKYVLFDLDGTITNSEEGITKSAAYALEKMGITEQDQERLKRFIGPPLTVSFRDFYGMNEEQAEEGMRLYRERYGVTGWKEACVYEGIPELLNKLKEAGAKIAVATSKPQQYTDMILEHFGVAKYFGAVSGADIAEKDSGKSGLIKKALTLLGKDDWSSCSDVVMIGDRKFDTLGAGEVGTDFIGVSYGFAPKGEFEALGVEKIASSAAELEKYLLVNE
ncbi:MAG: HAD hydrolase-like protein [Lachnospiraceae bacterium]|nr:HAD hydrolase-like protein [Lachnospiraceae bacterium]